MPTPDKQIIFNAYYCDICSKLMLLRSRELCTCGNTGEVVDEISADDNGNITSIKTMYNYYYSVDGQFVRYELPVLYPSHDSDILW